MGVLRPDRMVLSSLRRRRQFALLLMLLGMLVVRHQNRVLPVASSESLYQLASSRQSEAPLHNITAAICHKTIFGHVDLPHVTEWALYHRLLGFDHIYIWHVPDVATREHFAELAALPFVTMVPNTIGTMIHYERGLRMDRGKPGNQLDDEKECLQKVAVDYDWVFLADADEFLWLKNVTVKDWMREYKDLTYMSFGKWQYTTKYYHNTSSTKHFEIQNFPFTARSLCYHHDNKERRGREYCPMWKGRSKLIVRPKYHPEVQVHGRKARPRKPHQHFATSQAHIKEWPSVYKPGLVRQWREPTDYNFLSNETDLHFVPEGLKANEDGTFNMYYDDQLDTWIDFVVRAGRA